MVVIDVSFSDHDQVVDFSKIHKTSKASITFALSKNGTCLFGKGRFVMIPYLCRSAMFTVMSSSKLIGVSRLCVLAGLSSFGFSSTLNS